MTTNEDRMIADAKRAARRLARTRSETYQECLDIVARDAGSTHWADFIRSPVDIRSIDRQKNDSRSTHEAADGIGNHDGKGSRPTGPGGDGYRGLPGGEGILLGFDLGRAVRSARRSAVLCVGDAATGKTTGIVMTTIAMSPGASQIIHDPNAEIIGAVSRTGVRGRTRMLSFDMMDEVTPAGIEKVSFNPLHPAFYADMDTWAHARAVAAALMVHQPVDHYFAVKARDLLAAIMAYLMLRPDRIPKDGGRQRMASLPGVVDWLVRAYERGMENDFRQIVADCADMEHGYPIISQVTPVIDMMPNERTAILGTLDKALLIVKSTRTRRFFDPEDCEHGAMLVHALADADVPATIFLTCRGEHAILSAVPFALAIGLLAEWRKAQGPSGRSLQIIIDEGERMAPTAAISDMLENGAPAGIALLMVLQNLSQRRTNRTWMTEGGRPTRFDHVISLVLMPSMTDVGFIKLFTGCGDDVIDIRENSLSRERHSVVSIDGVRHLDTSRSFLLDPRTGVLSEGR